MPYAAKRNSSFNPRPPDRRPSSVTRGYGARWPVLRARYLARHPFCATCRQPATQVDHIISRARGGADEDSNYMALCASCHSRKTVREDGGFGKTPRTAT